MDFLGTCHIWGTTVSFFKKFKLSAFRKVYGLWTYFQPVRSYHHFKFLGNQAKKMHVLDQKTRFFGILADNGRIGVIWPEIDPRGVLKSFCTRIRYLIAYMKHFTKIEKNRFFKILICGYGQKLTSKWPNPADISRKIFPAGLDTPCLFPEKNVLINSQSFRR